MVNTVRLSPEIRELLENSGVPWRVDEGKRHHKIIVNGKFCGILPKGPMSRTISKRGHEQLNTIAQIRRAIRGRRP